MVPGADKRCITCLLDCIRGDSILHTYSAASAANRAENPLAGRATRFSADKSKSLQTPPSFLAVIDPVALQVVSRIRLPDECLAPHGLVIDVQQREAFVACVNSQNLVRVDLRTMRPFPGDPLPVAFNPDIVRLDHPLQLLFVGCAGGISIFDESGRGLKKLGSDYFLGGGSHHTIAIDETTQVIYLPQPSVGGRPILRVIKYVANGV